jgi:hypothetical protein
MTIWRMPIACWIPKPTNTFNWINQQDAAGRPDHDQQHCYHQAPTVNQRMLLQLLYLLMMGMRKSETCWALFKRQVINLRSCCIFFVDSVESMMTHGLANAKSTNTHSEYAIIIALPLQQWLHERSSMLRYTYTACVVVVKNSTLKFPHVLCWVIKATYFLRPCIVWGSDYIHIKSLSKPVKQQWTYVWEYRFQVSATLTNNLFGLCEAFLANSLTFEPRCVS